MNVNELISKRWGIETTYDYNPLVNQIAVTKTRFLDLNPNRLSFVLVNVSAVSVFVGPDSDVALTKGIELVASGGTLSMVWTEDFELPTNEWWGIANGAAADIYVVEVLIQA